MYLILLIYLYQYIILIYINNVFIYINNIKIYKHVITENCIPYKILQREREKN